MAPSWSAIFGAGTHPAGADRAAVVGRPGRQLPVESTLVKVGEADIECFVHGTGRSIILLPGGSLSVGYLSDLASALAASGLCAVRLNPRGAGRSVGPMEDLTLHDYASDVAGVAQELGLAPTVVLGHAFGNRIARTVAADRPDLVRGVVLVSAGGKVEPVPEAQRALATLFTPTATEAEVVEAMRWMVGSPENAASVWERFKGDRAPGAAAAQMSAARATPLEEWWAPPGDVAYLVVQGLDDAPAPPANGHLLKDELGDRVTVVDIPDAGHLQPLEAPSVVAEAVISFVSSLDDPVPSGRPVRSSGS
ncbi:alpha/beta hydrolase [Nocardioides sp. zg-1308]|uniref:alpha/beta fold hydrolase n=1 Tax=Nocardioides sp. zg-1308 TaxID=2736253 RepID=UPI00155833F5|nr:alpha/beta hydrolase [Nocardioides sp. zg-1308]